MPLLFGAGAFCYAQQGWSVAAGKHPKPVANQFQRCE